MLLHREEFLNVIQRSVVIAPADSPMESLECVLLEADHSTQKLTVTATNVELSLEQRLPCKTDRDDALLVNARLLAAMLERLDGDTPCPWNTCSTGPPSLCGPEPPAIR